MYVTAIEVGEAYSADDVFGKWHFDGVVASAEQGKSYWAPDCVERRTARICKLHVCDGTITAERYEDRI